MSIRAAQSSWQDEPNKTTPMNAARLNYGENRVSDIAAEVEAMIAGGARTPGAYGVKGDGTTDDTANMQAFLNACKEAAGVIPPGAYLIKGALKVPNSTEIVGANMRSTRFIKEGNGNLFELMGGDLRVSNIQVTAQAEQASGNGFCIPEAGENIRMDNIQLSSNFFCGFNLAALTGEFGSVYLNTIRIKDPIVAGVVGMKGPVFKIGDTNHRMYVVSIDNVQGTAKQQASVKTWFEMNNCDTVWLTNVLCQTGTNGLLVGNNDASSQKTTNLKMAHCTFDGGPENFVHAMQFANNYATDLTACQAQGGEVVIEGETHGLTWTGGLIQASNVWGLRFLPSAIFPVLFNGAKIGNNNWLKETTAERGSDILVEAVEAGGAERIAFLNCLLGDDFHYGAKTDSLYAVCFKKTSGATAKGGRVAFLNCPFNNSLSPGALKGFDKNEWTGSYTENKVYGLATSPATPVPLIW